MLQKLWVPYYVFMCVILNIPLQLVLMYYKIDRYSVLIICMILTGILGIFCENLRINWYIRNIEKKLRNLYIQLPEDYEDKR